MNGFKKMTVLLLPVFTAAVFVAVVSSFADNPPPAKAPKAGKAQKMPSQPGQAQNMLPPGADAAKAAIVLKRFSEERDKRIKSELKLGTVKSFRLSRVLAKYDELMKKELDELSLFKIKFQEALNGAELSDEAARDFIVGYGALEKAAYETRQKRYGEIGEVLTQQEMVNFIVFEKRLMLRMDRSLASQDAMIFSPSGPVSGSAEGLGIQQPPGKDGKRPMGKKIPPPPGKPKGGASPKPTGAQQPK